jgi:hypothetical protein
MGLSTVNNLVTDEVNYQIARQISYVASTRVTQAKLGANEQAGCHCKQNHSNFLLIIVFLSQWAGSNIEERGSLRSSKHNKLNSPKTISTMFKHNLNGNYVSCCHNVHVT